MLRFAQWSPLFWQFEEFGVSNAFPLSGFVAFGTRNPLLRYGIDARCAKQPPGVRDAFSDAFGAKNRLLGYGMNCLDTGALRNYLAKELRTMPK